MAADNVETAFRLPGGVNEDFIKNLLWQHHQQQQRQENIKQKRQQNINQYASPPPTPAMSQMSSGNEFNETEEPGF